MDIPGIHRNQTQPLTRAEVPASRGIAGCRAMAIPLAALLLAGCETAYTVDMRNFTDQAVTARVFQRRIGEKNKLLDEERIAPGDRETLGPVYSRTPAPIFIEVDFPGNVGHVSDMELDQGTTVVNVHRRDEGVKGEIELEVVPRK